MAKLETSVVINRPIEDVFAYVSNPENESLWQSGVVESSLTSQGPMGVGSTAREVRRFLGRRIETTYELTEYEPNKKLSFKTTSGPISGQGGYSFESVEGDTRVTFLFEAQLGGFFKLAEPIVNRMARRQMEADSGNLKDLLEAQA